MPWLLVGLMGVVGGLWYASNNPQTKALPAGRVRLHFAQPVDVARLRPVFDNVVALDSSRQNYEVSVVQAGQFILPGVAEVTPVS